MRVPLIELNLPDDVLLVRTLLSHFSHIPNSMSTQTRVLNEAIEWAQKEHRIFLKQSLETRLGSSRSVILL